MRRTNLDLDEVARGDLSNTGKERDPVNRVRHNPTRGHSSGSVRAAVPVSCAGPVGNRVYRGKPYPDLECPVYIESLEKICTQCRTYGKHDRR
jgi:hypothetical protein